jgi:very-short-patch-repair endonuclease
MAKLRGGEDYPIYFGARPEIRRLAAELRLKPTRSEMRLWAELRNRKLLGFKFRRQHPFNVLVLDFFCNEASLAIEVDGNVHADISQRERDAGRTMLLNKYGITELRFSNDEVESRMTEVLEKIKLFLMEVNPPSPGRGKGRG